MNWNFCVRIMPIAVSAFPTVRCRAGSPPPGCCQAPASPSRRDEPTSSPSRFGSLNQKSRAKHMSLENLIGDGRPSSVSFEFSPPKNDEAEQSLWATIRRLEPLRPAFVSVTYGAGGSTRERTHATVKRIVEETSLKPAAHLTCVGASRGEIDDIVRAYWDAE